MSANSSPGRLGSRSRMRFTATPRGGFLVGVSLLLLLVAAAACGFRWIEGWSLAESLYMAVITISTVGFGEVRPLSQQGRFFTVTVILVGVMIVTYTTAKLGQMILEGELIGQWRQRRMKHQLDKISQHYVICGYGRVGRPVAQGLREAGLAFCIVDGDRELESELEDEGFLYVIGDATDEDVLLSAGVARARALMALLPSDADNLYLTVSAKGINPDVNLIARASQAKAAAKLVQGGANKVVSPYSMAGERVLQAALRPTVVEFMEGTSSRADLALLLDEVRIATDSALDGTTLREAEVRTRYGVIVVAIKRQDKMVYNPGAEEPIQAQDVLVIVGPRKSLREFASQARGESA